jgi:hypothetical protein
MQSRDIQSRGPETVKDHADRLGQRVEASVLLEGVKRAGPHLDTERLVEGLETLRDFDMGLGTCEACDQRHALMDAAYDDQVYVDDRTIDSHVKRLRKKFKASDNEFDVIETLYVSVIALRNYKRCSLSRCLNGVPHGKGKRSPVARQDK